MFLCLAPIEVDRRELAELVDIIREAANLSSLDKLAAALEMDRAQLQRQMDGNGHVSLSRIVATLGHHDPSFYAELGWALVKRYGPTAEAWREAITYLGFIGRRRQLKMDATSVSQKVCVR